MNSPHERSDLREVAYTNESRMSLRSSGLRLLRKSTLPRFGPSPSVMAGLDPAIHVFLVKSHQSAWMPEQGRACRTSQRQIVVLLGRHFHLLVAQHGECARV